MDPSCRGTIGTIGTIPAYRGDRGMSIEQDAHWRTPIEDHPNVGM